MSPLNKEFVRKDKKEIDNLIKKHEKIRDQEIERRMNWERVHAQGVLKKAEPITDPEKHEKDLIELQSNFEDYNQDNGVIIHPIDHKKAWRLWYKESANLGKSHRVVVHFTIQPRTEQAWRNFVHVFTGQPIRQGIGTASALVELAMKILIAIVADFKIEETAKKLGEIIGSSSAKEQIKQNILKLAQFL